MSAIARLNKYPINMVLFGPPGVGKGSYCKMLSRDLKLAKFSSGDFFRNYFKELQSAM